MNSGNNQAKTKQQLAKEYGICVKTFNKWLKKENLKIERGLVSPRIQQLIHRKFDAPKNSE